MTSARPTALASPALAPRPSPWRFKERNSSLGDLFVGLEQLYRTRRHHSRYRMLIDKLRMMIAAQKYREVIEPGHNPLQFHSIDQKYCDRRLVLSNVVQEYILQVLRFLGGRPRSPLLFGVRAFARTNSTATPLRLIWAARGRGQGRSAKSSQRPAIPGRPPRNRPQRGLARRPAPARSRR